jgi:hypothetical protein
LSSRRDLLLAFAVALAFALALAFAVALVVAIAVALAVAVALVVASLVVIPEGDLLLFSPLFVRAVVCFCRCLFLLSSLSAAKDPGTTSATHTARTFQPGLSALSLSGRAATRSHLAIPYCCDPASYLQ